MLVFLVEVLLDTVRRYVRAPAPKHSACLGYEADPVNVIRARTEAPMKILSVTSPTFVWKLTEKIVRSDRSHPISTQRILNLRNIKIMLNFFCSF